MHGLQFDTFKLFSAFFLPSRNFRSLHYPKSLTMSPKPLFLAALLLTVLLAFGFNLLRPTNQDQNAARIKKTVIGCSVDWKTVNARIDQTDIPLMPGAGNYAWKIDTQNDSAQIYFNQGINMYYGFHIIEAMASFRKAAKFDPNSAMLEWAQALAYGPNINDVGYSASPDALRACRKAAELSAHCSDKEKLLIEAQRSRYSSDSTESREKLNQLYVDKMKEAYGKYPGDADIAVLYADAMMLQHPWDLWKPDGTPKPWTPAIRNVLEQILSTHPEHPGANHYYIHVMEPSPFASLAIASADRLGKLNPGLSHVVHMPSHIYLRTGNYKKGIEVNEAAVASYSQYIPLYAPVTGNDFLYIIHNLHMQTNHAMMAGRAGYSNQSADALVNSIQKDYLEIPGALGNYIQYIYMTPVLVNIRFGQWQQLLEQPQPVPSQVYGNILYHFGRGMAFAHQSQLQDATTELATLKKLVTDSSLSIPFAPFSPAIDGAHIAESLLEGSIALQEKKYEAAITAFLKAVSIEESMVYNEPRDWLLNPKHFLGDAYLQAGRPAMAEKIFFRDLQNNQENGWALYGLYRAYLMNGKKSDAAKTLARYKKAFADADVELKSSVL